jgi:hypothetical protein
MQPSNSSCSSSNNSFALQFFHSFAWLKSAHRHVFSLSPTMYVLHSARIRKSVLSSSSSSSSGGGNNKAETKSASLAAVSINIYIDVPSFELSLDEFEVFAIKRLKV